ncbi:MAG TPA: BMC domain-containing protein [Elusimicrobiales bacterium]|nr:BMC domain-containing protein [Elusimicrobiales bacterium]
MQADIAVGLLETSSIARGVEALDAMCKAAGVEIAKSEATARGKYLIIITGPVGEVESSLRAGADIAKGAVVAEFIIRNVHKDALSALSAKNKNARLEAVAMLETKDAMAALYGADTACKAAKVALIEIKLGSGIGGKGFFSITGEVGAVKTAVSAAAQVLPEEAIVSKILIPNAHSQLGKALL